MRPTRDEWAIGVAELTARRTTCLRRAVGCVLLNERGHVLATGYNGVAAGRPHCNEFVTPPPPPELEAAERAAGRFRVVGWASVTDDEITAWTPHACAGATAPSGKSLDGCDAIHAEQNALLQCRDVWAIAECFVTASPCVTCVKLLLNTTCKRIVFRDEYPHPHARELWTEAGRTWVHLPRTSAPA